MYPPVVTSTDPPLMFSAEAIFSRVASNVTRVGQPPERISRPLAISSLWIWPSGLAAYTNRRSGSAIGVAVVIWALPS